jgi:hypothetical protein
MKPKKPKQEESPSVRPSAFDLRVIREEWSEADLALRYSRAHALRILRRHYKATIPDIASQMMRAIQMEIIQSHIDCLNLDAWLETKGMPPKYVKGLASLHEKRVIDALHFRAWDAITQPPRPTKSQLLSRKAQLVLHRIRERLRDGNSPTDAISLESFPIKRMAEDGDADFFTSLGSLVSEAKKRPDKYSKRPLSSLIVKAWLPLRLWECPANGLLAYERCTEAATLIDMKPLQFDEFAKAWKNVRTRAMKTTVEHTQSAYAN